MSRFLKQSFALLILTTLGIVSIFGVCKEMTAVNQAGHEQMMAIAIAKDCVQEASFCIASPVKDHMAIFTDAFPMILAAGLALVFVQSVFLWSFHRASSLSLKLENLRHRLKYRFGQELARFISPPNLQFAFSQGILHPKKDA